MRYVNDKPIDFTNEDWKTHTPRERARLEAYARKENEKRSRRKKKSVPRILFEWIFLILIAVLFGYVSVYTFGQQRNIFVEECSEAIQAVCKIERAADISAAKYNEEMWKLIGEVADVLIMALQMRKYLGVDYVDNMVMIKLDRQLDKIKFEDYAKQED